MPDISFMLVRYPWESFPPVLTHASVMAVESHPAHRAARAGDYAAARTLVRSLVTMAAWTGRVDYVCPVIQFHGPNQWNAIPTALAEFLAEQTGAKLAAHVIAELPHVDHPIDSTSQLLHQTGFDGTLPKGSYLICTDVVGFGSALANLRGHVMHQGGDVVAAVALAAQLFSSTLVPDATVITGIAARFRHDLSTIKQTLGVDYDRLTAREAYFLYGLETLEPLRNPKAPTHRVVGAVL